MDGDPNGRQKCKIKKINVSHNSTPLKERPTPQRGGSVTTAGKGSPAGLCHQW